MQSNGFLGLCLQPSVSQICWPVLFLASGLIIHEKPNLQFCLQISLRLEVS